MASSKLDSLNVRGSSSLSLNQRFSQLTRTKPKLTASDPRKLMCGTAPMVLLLHSGPASLQGSVLSVNQFLRRWRWRGSWSRLDRLQVAQRRHLSARRGFWGFRNKYRLHSCCHVTFKRRSKLRLQGHGSFLSSAAPRGRGRKKASVLSRKQLDAQLDKYMSTTKSRLDKDLEDYMSLSKSRLDAELDEYMSLAGQSDLCWQ